MWCYLVWLIFTVDVHSLTANDSTKHTLLRRMKFAQVCFDSSLSILPFIWIQFSYALFSYSVVLFSYLSLSVWFRWWLFQRATATSKQLLSTVKSNTCNFNTCQNTTNNTFQMDGFQWCHLSANSDNVTFHNNRFSTGNLLTMEVCIQNLYENNSI